MTSYNDIIISIKEIFRSKTINTAGFATFQMLEWICNASNWNFTRKLCYFSEFVRFFIIQITTFHTVQQRFIMVFPHTTNTRFINTVFNRNVSTLTYIIYSLFVLYLPV